MRSNASPIPDTLFQRTVESGAAVSTGASAQLRDLGSPDLLTLRVTLEPRVLLVKKQIHDSSWSVALLSDDDLRFAFERVAILVDRAIVEFLPIQKHDQVSVLLDRARLTQVGELRPLVVARALLRRARELRQCHDRHLELLG